MSGETVVAREAEPRVVGRVVAEKHGGWSATVHIGNAEIELGLFASADGACRAMRSSLARRGYPVEVRGAPEASA